MKPLDNQESERHFENGQILFLSYLNLFPKKGRFVIFWQIP
jgi:hypothetical protein